MRSNRTESTNFTAMITVTINGKSYTDKTELEKLGRRLGQLPDKMSISDEELDLALAMMPLISEFAREHGDRSMAGIVSLELERFRHYKEARKSR